MGIDQLTTLIIIHYQYQSIIGGNVSRYDSWEQESLLRCFVTVCCAWNNFLLPRKSLLGIPHRRSGGHGHLQHRHKKKEEEEITSLIVFERRLRPRLVESLR